VRSLVVVAGIPIDDVTMAEAVDRVATFVEEGRFSGRTHQIATVNVDFVVTGCGDPELGAILQRADLTIPDGMPIVWASKLFGRPVRERVAGADLVPELAALAAQHEYSMMLFGSAPGVAESVAATLASRHPGLRIIGYGGPMFDRGNEIDDEVLDVVRTAAPDILCVALGHPKQEYWIDAYRDKLDVPVLIGVGGSLDFIAGTKSRAPVWIREIGLEWLHRLATEPRRLAKRYARDFVRFTPLIFRQFRTMGIRANEWAAPAVERVGEAVVVRPTGGVDLWANFDALDRGGAFAAGTRVVVEMSRVRRLDQATAASLVALEYELRHAGSLLVLAAVPVSVSVSMVRLGLDKTFTVVPDVATALEPSRFSPKSLSG
jgi:N-acetylglucosaminyldiphosphoundecaprenol N-acetyl-beta-D-mannosaminyltransferase